MFFPVKKYIFFVMVSIAFHVIASLDGEKPNTGGKDVENYQGNKRLKQRDEFLQPKPVLWKRLNSKDSLFKVLIFRLNLAGLLKREGIEGNVFRQKLSETTKDRIYDNYMNVQEIPDYFGSQFYGKLLSDFMRLQRNFVD